MLFNKVWVMFKQPNVSSKIDDIVEQLDQFMTDEKYKK